MLDGSYGDTEVQKRKFRKYTGRDCERSATGATSGISSSPMHKWEYPHSRPQVVQEVSWSLFNYWRKNILLILRFIFGET